MTEFKTVGALRAYLAEFDGDARFRSEHDGAPLIIDVNVEGPAETRDELRELHTRSTPTVEATEQRIVDTSSIALRAAAAEDAGTFEGYAVLWDVEDSWGTRFAPGSAAAGGLDEDLYALLDMHDRDKPIGTFTAVEDDRGLLIKGTWDDTAAGRDARARARSGSAPGLSVGFQALMLDPDDETRFTQIRLVEVSQITARMQAVPGAGFTGVRKGKDEADAATRAQLAVARARLALAARPL